MTVLSINQFGLALSRGQPFSDQQTLKQMMVAQGKASIGLGHFIGKTENGIEYFYHFGHWGVMLFVVPSKQLAIAFTINQGEAEYAQFLEEILEVVLF